MALAQSLAADDAFPAELRREQLAKLRKAVPLGLGGMLIASLPIFADLRNVMSVREAWTWPAVLLAMIVASLAIIWNERRWRRRDADVSVVVIYRQIAVLGGYGFWWGALAFRVLEIGSATSQITIIALICGLGAVGLAVVYVIPGALVAFLAGVVGPPGVALALMPAALGGAAHQVLGYLVLESVILVGLTHLLYRQFVDSLRLQWELKRTEAALRENRDLLLEIQQLSGTGYALLDAEIGRMRWSDSLYRMRRAPAKSSMTLAEANRFLHPDDRSRMIVEREAELANARPAPVIGRVVRGDGTIGWEQSVTRRRHDETGAAIGELTVIQDISALKEIESDLKRSSELLQASQRLGKTGYIFSLVKEDKVFFSDSMFELRGIPKQPWFTPDEALKFVHPEDRDIYWAARADAVRERRNFAIENRIIRPNGEIYWEYAVGQPIYDADGALHSVMVSIQDITEQKKFKEMLAAEKERAEAASRAKSNFLAMMSHELRTPLNAVIGFAQLMHNEVFGPLGDPRYVGYARDIAGSGSYLLEVLNDVLDLVKLEAGKIEIDVRPADIAEIVRGLGPILMSIATEAGHRLTLRADEACPAICDRRRVRQILLNLASNAAKYTKRGGEIVVAVFDEADGSPALSVTDNGVGMAAPDIERATELFTRLEHKLDRMPEGVGIGLYMVKRLAETMGARLRIDSELGVGTTVTISFAKA